MWAFVILLALLAAVSLYLWKYQTAYFSKVVLALGIVGELVNQLNLFDWNSVLPPPYAGWMTFTVIVVSFLARFTKSQEPAT